MGRKTLWGSVLFMFVFLSYEANSAGTTVSSSNKPTSSAKSTTTAHSKNTTAHSTVSPAPTVNTAPSSNITTTTHSNHTTANSTGAPAPIVNTTTPSTNTTTTPHSNHTTANSTVTPAPIVNTTTPSTNTTTTPHSNHTTANSTVTPAPIVNTTTPSTNTTTPHSNHTTSNSTVTPAPIVNTTTPSTNTTTTPHSNQTTHATNSTTQPLTPTPKPTFSPKPSPPTVGNYSVNADKGAFCIMASMGLELVIHNKEDSFYNVEPTGARASGHCAKNSANLNITFKEGFINFNFLSDNTSYFVDHIEVLLSSLPVQQVSKQNLLNTKLGSSFRCKSKVDVDLGKNITLSMINTRLQAFSIDHNQFGKDSECSADYRAPIAVAVGITVVLIIVLGIIIYFIYRSKKLAGYQRI